MLKHKEIVTFLKAVTKELDKFKGKKTRHGSSSGEFGWLVSLKANDMMINQMELESLFMLRVICMKAIESMERWKGFTYFNHNFTKIDLWLFFKP